MEKPKRGRGRPPAEEKMQRLPVYGSERQMKRIRGLRAAWKCRSLSAAVLRAVDEAAAREGVE